MARNGNSTGSKWKGFYRHELTDKEKSAVKKLSDDAQSILGSLVELADNGYKCSISYSVDKSAYFVTATGTDRSDGNAGWSLTQAHSSADVAIRALWFIIGTVYNWEPWPDQLDDEVAHNW